MFMRTMFNHHVAAYCSLRWKSCVKEALNEYICMDDESACVKCRSSQRQRRREVDDVVDCNL